MDHYLQLGYRLIPLKPNSKEPLLRNWPEKASSDPKQIEAWARAYPGCNWGLVPDEPTLVLDVDDTARLGDLLATHPELDEAPRQRTPRGGAHILLRLPPDAVGKIPARAKWRDGIDIRGLGRSYIVVAPSVVNDRPYTWERPLTPSDQLPGVPPPLLQELLPKLKTTPTPAPTPAPTPQGETVQKRLRGLLQWACEVVASTPEGKRHNTLLAYARFIGGYLHLGLDEAEAHRALYEAALKAGLDEKDAWRTAKDGLEDGRRAPLELPPSDLHPSQEPPPERPQAPPAEGAGAGRKAASTLAIQLALSQAKFWLDADTDTPWATIPRNGHQENWPVRSPQFKRWLASLFYANYGRALGGQALQDALLHLEAEAEWGPKYPTHYRVAMHNGEIYLDLGRPDWLLVRINPQGVELVRTPPPELKFRRVRAMGELPIPDLSGTADDLKQFFKLWGLDDKDCLLLVAWTISPFVPGPHPVLVLNGPQGTGKTTLTRRLRALIDPGGAVHPPRDVRDLVASALRNHILAYDNVSWLEPWLSDTLCQVATGAWFEHRELYTNTETVIVKVKNPIILNGIVDFVTSPDLIDRALVVRLNPPEVRLSEEELREEFQKLHPRLLGAILNLVSLALRNLDETPAPDVRMADFARWAVAAEEGYAPRPGLFMEAYVQAREEAETAALESEPLFEAIQALLEQGAFEGTAQELLEQLNELRGDEKPPLGWPRTPRALAGKLQRLLPVLQRRGVEIAPTKRVGGRRIWRIEKTAPPPEGPDSEGPGPEGSGPEGSGPEGSGPEGSGPSTPPSSPSPSPGDSGPRPTGGGASSPPTSRTQEGGEDPTPPSAQAQGQAEPPTRAAPSPQQNGGQDAPPWNPWAVMLGRLSPVVERLEAMGQRGPHLLEVVADGEVVVRTAFHGAYRATLEKTLIGLCRKPRPERGELWAVWPDGKRQLLLAAHAQTGAEGGGLTQR